jgi:hypothetical protein
MRKINFVADDASLVGLVLAQAAPAADRGDPSFGAVLALEGKAVADERGASTLRGFQVLARSVRPR